MWFEALKEQLGYRKAKARFECPVVAVTAQNTEEVVQTAAKVGIKKVLFKPVDIRVLT